MPNVAAAAHSISRHGYRCIAIQKEIRQQDELHKDEYVVQMDIRAAGQQVEKADACAAYRTAPQERDTPPTRENTAAARATGGGALPSSPAARISPPRARLRDRSRSARGTSAPQSAKADSRPAPRRSSALPKRIITTASAAAARSPSICRNRIVFPCEMLRATPHN